MNASAPLLNAYRDAGAEISPVAAMNTGTGLAVVPGTLYLADLTPLPKLLLVGGAARSTLAAAGVAAPPLMQIAARGGGYVACRAPRQYLVCADSDGLLPSGLADAPCALRYDSVDLAVGGGSGEQGIEDLLAEACPIDLAQFNADSWIPTLLFGIEVALWRPRQGHYRLLAAPADGEFLAATLLAAVRRRHGALAGFQDYFAMHDFQQGG